MADDLLEQTFAGLYKEPRESVRDREANSFDRLAGRFNRRLILFGASELGKAALRGLREVGNPPLFFADNNPKLWGTNIDGVEVLSGAEAVERYRSSACFIVTIYNGSPVRSQLKQRGCECVIHFAHLFWKYPNVFVPSSCMGLPSVIFDNADQIRSGYNVLSDDCSRKLFCEQLRWRVLLNSEDMMPPSRAMETYFPPDLIKLSDHEVLVDCGAYDGDSIRGFLNRVENCFDQIYALEPDSGNRRALEYYCRTLPDSVRARITVLPYALGKTRSKVYFSNDSLVSSKITAVNAAAEVECLSLDELAGDRSPSFIKMDIEGAEPDAIEGASRILNEHQPMLAACVYHRSEHLWEIPWLIRKVSPHHSIFLRRYAEDCWELVCYAIPKRERSPASISDSD
jgi:FkbM family methyltransferase